jgi:nitrogen fixation-related uncharacterized protein
MEILALVVLVIVAVLAFEVAALVWGVDSREQFPDDHRRPTTGGSW